jgi:hypothetical protein
LLTVIVIPVEWNLVAGWGKGKDREDTVITIEKLRDEERISSGRNTR